MLNKSRYIFIPLLLALIALALPQHSYASASLYFNPATGSFAQGQTFSVSVYVSSPSQSINAVSAVISFPQEQLQVTSLSKSGSIVSFWAQEPEYSNNSGSVSFEGVIPNPGYQGGNGKLVSITFRSLASGTAQLRIVAGSVLANDGAGTNITSSLGSASYSIGSTSPVKSPAPTSPKLQQNNQLPIEPKVKSGTHPDSSKWYANNNAGFSWDLPAGVTAVNVLADRQPTTDPGSNSDGLIKEYVYKEVADGISYFHIKFKNSKDWGPTSHYKFQIDRTPPKDLKIRQLKDLRVAGVNTNRISMDNGLAFALEAKDDSSGMDRYAVNIDGREVKINPEFKDFEVSTLERGKHQLSVIAFDQAGNSTTETLEFTVEEPAKDSAKIDFELARFLFWLLFSILLAIALSFFSKKISHYFKHRRNRQRMLGKDIAQDISILEETLLKRPLTKEEVVILSNLRNLYYKANDGADFHPSKLTVDGIFNGEHMVGETGQIYEVPKNYASKSKLVEGDHLRMSYSTDGQLVYKQIGPVDRVSKTGKIVGENGNWMVQLENKTYKILPAAASFYKIQEGDTVEVFLPSDGETEWAAIDHIVESRKRSQARRK
jgi:hypothetical protein